MKISQLLAHMRYPALVKRFYGIYDYHLYFFSGKYILFPNHGGVDMIIPGKSDPFF